MPLFVTDKSALEDYRVKLDRTPETEKLALMQKGQSQSELTSPGVFYFLHIPKCGGTSVAHLMRDQYPGSVIMPRLRDNADKKHCRISHINELYDVSLTSVRHPLSWYESWWRYLLSPKVTDRNNILDAQGRPDFDAWVGEGCWHPLRKIAHCHDAVFSTFIDNIIQDQPGFVSEMYETYLSFSSGTVNVDHVLRMENLSGDYGKFCKTYGLSVPNTEKHENRSRRDLKADWALGQKEKLAELEVESIRFFGYSNGT